MALVNVAPLQPLMAELWDRKGTDLILAAGAPPLFRVDGEVLPSGSDTLSGADIDKLIAKFLPAQLLDRLEREQDVDFSFTWEAKARFRGNAFRQQSTTALALRMIPIEIPSFEDLGLPPSVEHLVALPQGLILVTGPTGAGKSTTLAAMLEHINVNRACHILTVEDPIEYVYEHKRSVVNQREIGEDAPSFARALRSALREDPDVLLVGEMRDLESIQIALTIAETGHLVFATLHTNDTAQALDRIVDVFPGERRDQIQVQLAGSLAAVIYQRLVPRAGGGLVAAYELMLANSAVRNLVREGKTRQLRNVVATSQAEGMQTLEMALSNLVATGVVDYEAAVAASLHPKEIERSASAAATSNEGRRRRR